MELGTQRYQSAETRAVVALIQNQLPAQWRSIMHWRRLGISFLRRTFSRRWWEIPSLRELVFEVEWSERCVVLPLADGRRLITLPDGQTVLHQPLPEPWLMYVEEAWRQHFIEEMQPL